MCSSLYTEHFFICFFSHSVISSSFNVEILFCFLMLTFFFTHPLACALSNAQPNLIKMFWDARLAKFRKFWQYFNRDWPRRKRLRALCKMFDFTCGKCIVSPKCEILNVQGMCLGTDVVHEQAIYYPGQMIHFDSTASHKYIQNKWKNQRHSEWGKNRTPMYYGIVDICCWLFCENKSSENRTIAWAT